MTSRTHRPINYFLPGLLLAINIFPLASTASSQVAFISDRGGEMDIYVFDTDTSATRRITEPGLVEYGVTWAPDGKWIYFVRYNEFDQNIWRIKPDGSGIEQVTEGEHQRNINQISPDGKRMLISSRRENPQGELYTMDLDGKNVKRITNNAFFEIGAAYAPDAKTIAVAVQTLPGVDRTQPGNSDLYLYDGEGRELKQLTKTDSTIEALPDFSPDGKKLAYHGIVHGVGQVMVLDMATGKSTTLTKEDPDSRWPRWTPDGKWIAYTRRTDDGGTDVWLMRPDGSGKRGFIVGKGRDEIAAFGPNMPKIPGQ